MEEAKLYTSETLQRTVPLDEFARALVDVPRFTGYCMDCPNHGQFWSCPPFDFDPMTLWGRYGQLLLFVRKVTFRKDRLFPGERRAFEEQELPKIKGAMARELLAMEAERPGSLALFPGRCDWCPVCARVEGRPCRTGCGIPSKPWAATAAGLWNGISAKASSGPRGTGCRSGCCSWAGCCCRRTNERRITI